MDFRGFLRIFMDLGGSQAEGTGSGDGTVLGRFVGLLRPVWISEDFRCFSWI